MIVIDPGTAAAAAASLLALDPVKKMLGPTADYIGTELAAFAKRRFSSAEKIIEIAAEHAAGSQPDETVSPRVLLDAVEEGSKIESAIAQKYFGGVLASSISKDGQDDSAIIFTSMLSEMSSAQIKFHCLLYSAFRERWIGAIEHLGTERTREKMTTIIDYSEMIREFGHEILHDLEASMFGLYRAGLIEHFSYGSIRLKPEADGIARGISPFIKFRPSVLGCSLFLAACGRDGRSSNEILNSSLQLKSLISIKRESVFAVHEIQEIDPATLQQQAATTPPIDLSTP